MYKIIGADQKEYGPVSLEQMRQWFAEGRINAQTTVWSDVGGNWKPCASYSELADLVASAPPPLAPSPASASVPALGERIPNYLIPAILCTLCCCLPFGIVAIVYAAKVNGKSEAGDYAGAQEASAQAKKWCWIAFGVGVVVNILQLFLFAGRMTELLNHLQ